MTLQPLPTDFVLSHVSLTWREILWGYDHGWINCKGLTELATRRLTTNDPTPPAEVELAGLVVGESSRARALAEELASQERPLSDEVIKRKWLYLILRWLFENRERAADPFALVD